MDIRKRVYMLFGIEFSDNKDDKDEELMWTTLAAPITLSSKEATQRLNLPDQRYVGYKFWWKMVKRHRVAGKLGANFVGFFHTYYVILARRATSASGMMKNYLRNQMSILCKEFNNRKD
ncbi:unnamed protein product [Dovyalis caffra]|uniref:Uncharacterized protein n=1 Tax=Dovyalis caffra TaxID=77055 RepID=A0AAV1RIX9_9ROSI|nr:unnamed protein product [Dovyalis caffra]